MDFVWFTSYLCIFMLGGFTFLFASVKIINKMIDRETKKLREGADTSLSEKLAPYTMNGHLN
jgi:hypothetical protein